MITQFLVISTVWRKRSLSHFSTAPGPPDPSALNGRGFPKHTVGNVYLVTPPSVKENRPPQKTEIASRHCEERDPSPVIARSDATKQSQGSGQAPQSDPKGHSEHIRGAQCKLREESRRDCLGCASQRHCVSDCHAPFDALRTGPSGARNDSYTDGSRLLSLLLGTPSMVFLPPRTEIDSPTA